MSGFRVRGGGGGGAVSPAFTETINLNIKAADSSATPTDAAGFALALAQAEASAAPTEAVKLGISGTGVNDSNAAPTETKTFTMRIWLSGSATAPDLGASDPVTNPANADGANNGTVATLQTAVAGNGNCALGSALGVNIPAGVSVASAVYRGWFKSVNTLITSSGNLYLHSLTGLFADRTFFTNAGLNTTVDHLSGDFTYDLIANGINTLAKLKDIRMLHYTRDTVSGVTPHVLTVDAGCIELAGAFT